LIQENLAVGFARQRRMLKRILV
jgi:hypothetical protein